MDLLAAGRQGDLEVFVGSPEYWQSSDDSRESATAEYAEYECDFAVAHLLTCTLAEPHFGQVDSDTEK